MKRLVVGLVTFATLAVSCTSGGGTASPVQSVNPSVSHVSVTLTVWDYFTERELSNLNAVLAGFKQQYPWIHLNIVPGKQFNDYVRGINAGTPIDVAIDPGPDNVAKYCSTGAFQNLAPYLQADHLNASSIFAPAALKYTSYQGVQCTLPLLTDAYGLYYNKDLFAKAHIAGPPKTLSEFTADVKKLTQFNPDGSIKTAGFVPLSGFYENGNLYDGNAWGTQWYTSDGKSAFGTDPGWVQMLQWNKSLVDYYGFDNLQKFFADLGGANSEWSSANGFEQGKIAMIYDGEWRESFIQNDGVKLNYGTAPFPVADDHPELYGSGQVGGTIIGIPRTSQDPADAWLLVKYLSTNTKALETLANLLKNVPTTFDSLKDPKLVSDPIFKTFLDIYNNPNSYFHPITPAGTADSDALSAFIEKWEAGKVSDLPAGLQQLASNVDQQLQLG